MSKQISISCLFFSFLLSNTSHTGEELSGRHLVCTKRLADFTKEIENSYKEPFNIMAILNKNASDTLEEMKTNINFFSQKLLLEEKKSILNKIPFMNLINLDITIEDYIKNELNEKITSFIFKYKEEMEKKTEELRKNLNDDKKNYTFSYKANRGITFFTNELKDIFKNECAPFINDMKKYVEDYCTALKESLKEYFSSLTQDKYFDKEDEINNID